MHSPAPMQNGGNFGMPMNNYGGSPNVGQTMRPQIMQNPDEMMGPNFAGNFNGPPQPNQMNQNYGMMPTGVQNSGMGVMSPHGNISPHQNPMMMPQPGPNQMMNMYPNQPVPNQHQMMPNHPGMMSPNQHNAPGIQSPLPQQQMMNQYPQPGISPNLGPHMMQQMIPNNVGGGMSPSNNGNNGMMSPHHQMMNQPGGPLAQGSPMMHHGGPPPPQGNRINMLPPHPGMMAQHGPGNMQNSHPGIMSPHGGGGMPPQMIMNHQQGQQGMMMAPPMQPNMNAKPYPNPSMIFNQQNPNAPPTYLCGACHREVQGDSDDAIVCESGCNYWFHRACINMSPEALLYLKKEVYAEWVCDNCMHTKRIAPIKFKS